jgi:hypothetical protein
MGDALSFFDRFVDDDRFESEMRSASDLSVWLLKRKLIVVFSQASGTWLVRGLEALGAIQKARDAGKVGPASPGPHRGKHLNAYLNALWRYLEALDIRPRWADDEWRHVLRL